MSDEQPTLNFNRPVARRTDPATSWEAARSLKEEKLRASQQLILTILRVRGPMTDEQILLCVQRNPDTRMSDSGCRTRRKELVDAGLVEDSGKRERTASGRKTIVWKAT